jgi:quercetin dioxygenase-like cupin family protein
LVAQDTNQQPSPVHVPDNEEVAMRRNVVVLALTLALGIAVGVIGERVLSAQPAPVISTDIFKADVVGVEGKEGIVQFVELLPRGASGIHYHPAHTFVYVMEGTLTVESEGHPPMTFKAGEAFQEAPGNVHEAKNLTGGPLKLVVFRVHPKGQPITVRKTDPHFVN